MQITDIKTFLVNPGSSKNWLFVKIETDGGLHGWGECYTQLDRDKVIEIHVMQLARYLKGRSPFDIKHFTFMAYYDFAGKRGAMDLYCAISGIEQAMWDIDSRSTIFWGVSAGTRSGSTRTGGAAGRIPRRLVKVPGGWWTAASPHSSSTRSRIPGGR